ncbi:hypothetical protein HNO92_002747 [Chromobacterium alkanivorans]|uniref:hypothetical protein n=1 Tax=Chromobacterium TaxID=535 RepID=UPI000654906F|nr:MULTISPECIES: hypothetical protein [Chromobacterium]KMN82284.1 hypothetical protein VK98_09315 [Chromobacterium sp. LK11]MCS3805258.1 hypothetical protein [Chromobacterium alkanivorans]MCS3819597.1 hypothetical protein [Chromobacterium alkanivorans]MCS3874428.1 hypothetical protein [Chromobacterium alkanivorans]
MMRKILDGVLWGLGFWLVGGGLMLMFSAFNSYQQAGRESAARAAQSGSVEDQWSRSEKLLARQEQSMVRSEQQLTRLDKILDKWERQK